MSTPLFKHIIFPVDIEDTKSIKSYFETVVTFAKIHQASLTVLTVIPDSGVQMMEKYLPKNWLRNLEKDAQKVLEGYVKTYVPSDISVNVIVGRGTIYDSINEEAKKAGADIIVMPARRIERSDYLLGPNAAKVVRHSDLTVMILR